jgi:hypothetical protein
MGKNMKWKIFGLAVILVIGLLITVPVSAVKPTANLAAAQFVPWHLSADVASVPPYGCGDIPGSDTASKLIVNQPNGNTEVTITGAMNGLHPNTVYTVFLSNGYTKSMNRWDITGDWDLAFTLGTPPSSYYHTMHVTLQNAPTCGADSSFVGTGVWNNDPSYTWDVTGTIKDNSKIDYHILYTGTGAGYYSDATGFITSGTTMGGQWVDSSTQSGDWTGTGVATPTLVTPGWTGYGTTGTTLESFTFTTDALGAGSWHVNLRDANFLDKEGKLVPGKHDLSVWINEAGGTMLISDPFTVTIG